MGDDLAVNAEKASGFSPSRELPVLWEITKKSFLNKFIIVPLMMLLNAYLPSLIIPILIMGGVYLSLEAVEKIDEYLNPEQHQENNKENNISEKDKIKSAVFTDFILSIEIVLIALSSVLNQPLEMQIFVVSIVSLLATVGVYGIVAIIVRMDDFGFWLIKKSITKEIRTEAKYKLEAGEIFTNKKKEIYHINPYILSFGNLFISLMTTVIKSLGYIGTIAMLLVAGGIFIHNIEILHHYFYGYPWFISLPLEITIAIIIGYIAFFTEKIIKYSLKR